MKTKYSHIYLPSICVFLLVVLLTSACGSSNPIVGKWKSTDNPLTITFSESGAFTIESDSGDKATGKYELTNQDHIRVVITDVGTLFQPTSKPEAVLMDGNFTISGEKLTVKSSTGSFTDIFEYTRVK